MTRWKFNVDIKIKNANIEFLSGTSGLRYFSSDLDRFSNFKAWGLVRALKFENLAIRSGKIM
jgi:hypothetical protein